MPVRFGLLVLLALFSVGGRSALALDEGQGVQVGDVKLTGRIDGQSFSFGLGVDVSVSKAGAVLPLVAGDLVLEDLLSPKAGVRPRYDVEARAYSLAFTDPSVKEVTATFAARSAALEGGAWRDVNIELPSARMRAIEISCDRTDLEVALPGALKVERTVVNEKLVISALLAPGRPLSVRWKPQVQQLDAKLVFATEANTIATVTAGALKVDTLFEFTVSQGKLTELSFSVPSNLSVTQVRGAHIRDWQLKPAAEAGKPASLTVALNRPVTDRYGLQVLSESVLPAFPAQAGVPVIEPVGGIRAGGALMIGTNSAIALVVKQTSGLSQINAAAFPRVMLLKDEVRALPQAKAFAFTHATTPYQMTVTLADIVPAFDTTQVVVASITGDDLALEGRIDLVVRDAPLREIVVEAPAGFEVVDVSGQAVDDFVAHPAEAAAAMRPVAVRFKQPVLGRTAIGYKLKLGKSPLGAAQSLGGLAVRGATVKRSFVVVAADAGVAVDVPKTTNMRDMSTAAVPVRVPGAQYAYSFRDHDWRLDFTARKKPASLRVESFHLLTLSEGVGYGNIAFNYAITGSPVDEFRFRIPANLQFIDLIGRDVRSVSLDPADPQVRIVKIARRVIGDYTLGMTYTLKYKDGDTIEIGGIECDGAQVQTQTGYMAVASNLNLDVTPAPAAAGAPTAPTAEVRLIDRDELPGHYQLLVNAPILRAFSFTRTPHGQKMKVSAFERAALLPVVIEVTDIRTEIFAHADSATESRTTVRYRIKNSSNQFLPLSMPQGVNVWQTLVGTTTVENEQIVDRLQRVAAAQDPKNKMLMIPLPRKANPNEPITVQVEYGAEHGELGYRGQVLLEAPATDPSNAVRSTYTNWTVAAPNWAVRVVDAPNLLPQPREQKHGGLAQVMTRAAAAWSWGWNRIGGAFSGQGQGSALSALLTIAVVLASLGAIIYCAWRRPGALPLMLTLVVLVALTGLGVLAAGSPMLSEAELQPDDLSTVVLTQTVTMDAREAVWLEASVTPQWRQHAWMFSGVIVPVLAIIVAVLMALPVSARWRLSAVQRGAVIIVALVALLYGMSHYLAFVPAILHLFTWVIPLCLLAYFLWRVLGRPALGLDDVRPVRRSASAVAGLAIALLLPTQMAQAQSGGAVLSVAPRQPVLDRVEAALKADGDHVEVDLSLGITALEPARMLLMEQGPIVLTPDDAEAPVRLEAQGGKYYLVVASAGEHVVKLKFLAPLTKTGDDAGRAMTFPLPLALTNRVTLTIPTTGLDVHVDQAMRTTLEEAGGATVVQAILGPGDDIAASWKPRARLTSQEKTSFYSQVISAARLDASLIEARHLVKFQIAQGELRDIRLRIAAPMTVTAVQGKALGAWRFDPAKQELEVRLSEPATGEYAMALITQISRDKLPYDAAIAPVIVQDAVRHSGIIGLLVSPAVQVSVTDGPAAMNVDDFAREADSLLRTFDGYEPGSVRYAYRAAKAEDAITVAAVEVKPELRVLENATFAITDDRLVYNGTVLIEVAKAGVFHVELKLPAGYDIDTLTAPQVSHWDDAVADGTRTVLVHLKEKFTGQAPLKLEISQPVATLPKTITAPRVAVTGAVKHTGQLIVVAERGVRMVIAERDGINDFNPLEAGVREQGALAFNLLKPQWSLTLATDVIEPRVTAEFLHVVKVREGLVRHTHHLRYELANAGSKVFEFQAPKGAQGLLIEGREIARRTEIEEGSGRYRVELNRKWFDQAYALTISYDTKFALPGGGGAAPGAIVIDPVKALGADQQRGHVVVLSTPRVELTVHNRSPAMQQADPRTIPGVFGVRDLASAAFCYSSPSAEYGLALSAQRHAAADLQEADARQTVIHTIVAHTGDSVTKVQMDLRVGSKQHLETILPAGAEIWTLLVNGRSTIPSHRTNAAGEAVRLIPLGAAAAGGMDVRIEFVYASPRPQDWSPASPAFTGPRFDLPLKKITWQLLMPAQADYQDFAGTMKINETVLQENRIERYGLRDYDAQVYNFNVVNSRIARDAQVAGARLLREGDEKRAQQAFEAAVHYSAFSEDARVQLHRFNSDKALLGLVGSRQRLREQPDGQIAAATVDVNTDNIARVKSSLSAADSENLADLTRVWTEVQEKAAGESVQLAVNMPYRGRVLEFERSVQVKENAPMQVSFAARPMREPAAAATRWWIVGLAVGFGALALLVPALARRWTSLPKALRDDDDDLDEDEAYEDEAMDGDALIK